MLDWYQAIQGKLKRLGSEAGLERSCAICGEGIHSQDQLSTGVGMELGAVPATAPMGHGLVSSRGSNGILDHGQGGRSPRNFGQGQARAMGILRAITSLLSKVCFNFNCS